VPRLKNVWSSYTSTPLYVFMARCLVKYRDNFMNIYMRCIFPFATSQSVKFVDIFEGRLSIPGKSFAIQDNSLKLSWYVPEGGCS
jgi:hypothetical protein